MLPSRTVILAEAKYARPFDQNLGFPLIYFFYLHTTIRLKYMFPFDFNLCARPFDQKSGFSLIYFFYVHTTIRPKYMVFFHLFFLLCTTIRPRLRVLTDLFFYLHMTIRQKCIVLFHLFFLLFTTIRPKLGSSFSIFHFHFIHFSISNKYNANIFVLTNWYIDTVGTCRRFANLIIKHQ